MLLLTLSIGVGTRSGPSDAAGAAALPDTRTVTIGHSVEGRPLRAFRLGDLDSPRKALVVGTIHGDERQGHRVIRRLRKRFRGIEGVDLWTIKSVNPDGVKRNRRKNAHGVDLNRNFSYRWSGGVPRASGYYPGPRPFSEPEARAVRDLVEDLRPDVSIWFHQPWGAVLACGGGSAIQRRYARIARMKVRCRGLGLHGTAISWQNHNYGGTAFVVEFKGGRLSKKTVKRSSLAAARIANS